ncbi:MAG: radical SAM protein [Bacteroidota bacterium]
MKLLLITPPFTQLNTPYPATTYLKGFLNTRGIASYQADLGIEVILELFSRHGLEQLFARITDPAALSSNCRRILRLKDEYFATIDDVIAFLQNRNPTLAHVICVDAFLPRASRFSNDEDLEWAFGIMGTRDKARHLATLYLEDLSDLIVEAVDPHFGFSRYAERLSMAAASFDPLYEALNGEESLIDEFLLKLLEEKITTAQPQLVALSVPFPGNLYGALKCGQYIKKRHPGIRVVMGGGYPNTELRSLKDHRLFECVDFITLDDGEAPLLNLLEHLEGKRELHELKRTLYCAGNAVHYANGSATKDFTQLLVGVPDYSDLPLQHYLSVIEIANPMHRLWSDGRWNKLTLAHGCYWGKCTFCDISLDYIQRYEPSSAKLLADKMETMIAQTGETGFHFVDEAAPPSLMKELALEIIRRKLNVSWWTNIRFEKSFTADLCRLLKASGCIAVSGGLEVASDRLLALIDKGVTVPQVARVTDHFTTAGIMVHAYLMFGFPTQTVQETVDSLEMVRQLFMHGTVQSGFWHQFAMTAHSPVGIDPAKFKVERVHPLDNDFANNDLEHYDPTGVDHHRFGAGLKKSLFNYMHGVGFDLPLHSWFDFKVPRTTVHPGYIENALNDQEYRIAKPNAKVVWLGADPELRLVKKLVKGKEQESAELCFSNKTAELVLHTDVETGNWLNLILPKLSVKNQQVFTYQQLREDFEQHNTTDFELFWHGKAAGELRSGGLLVV